MKCSTLKRWLAFLREKPALRTEPNPSRFTEQGSKLRVGDRVKVTPEVVRLICEEDLHEALDRHERFDFGDREIASWEAGSVDQVGLDHIGVYADRNGVRFCVETDSKKWVTTVMLWEEIWS